MSELFDVLAVLRHMLRMHEYESGENYDPGSEAIATVADLAETLRLAVRVMAAGVDPTNAIDRANAVLARFDGEKS